MTTAPDPAPLTEAELANIRDNLANAERSADPWEIVPNYRAVRGLLAEVDRLRAELAGLPDLDTIRRIEKERGSWGMQLSEARRELTETRHVADHNNAAFVKSVDELTAENTALSAAVNTAATALDNLGSRIYRDLRDEYDDIAERVGTDDAKMLRAFNAYAEEQLAVLSNPKVRAALGETGGTEAGVDLCAVCKHPKKGHSYRHEAGHGYHMWVAPQPAPGEQR